MNLAPIVRLFSPVIIMLHSVCLPKISDHERIRATEQHGNNPSMDQGICVA